LVTIHLDVDLKLDLCRVPRRIKALFWTTPDTLQAAFGSVLAIHLRGGARGQRYRTQSKEEVQPTWLGKARVRFAVQESAILSPAGGVGRRRLHAQRCSGHRHARDDPRWKS